MVTKVALVTGASRGLGFELVRQLCRTFDGVVILTAHDAGKGREAVRKLKEEGLDPRFLVVDVRNRKSIEAAKKEVERLYGGLDLLVPNARINPLEDGHELADRAEQCIRTNYYSALHTIIVFFSLLQPNAKVLVPCSESANLRVIFSPDLQERITSPSLTVEELSQLMEKYKEDVKSGNLKQNGWPSGDVCEDSYCVSEVGRIRLLELLACEFGHDSGKCLQFISISPGRNKHDIDGGSNENIPMSEGVETFLYIAALPPEDRRFNGKFIDCDTKPITWETIKMNAANQMDQLSFANIRED